MLWGQDWYSDSTSETISLDSFENVSSWNTTLLPVKKPDINDYWPVQDLQTITRYSHYPSGGPQLLYISWLHACIIPVVHMFEFKDACFFICLVPVSRLIFTFEREDPTTGQKKQLT